MASRLQVIFDLLATDNASGVLRGVGRSTGIMGKAVAAGAGAAGLAIGAFGASAVTAGSEFDATIRQIGAVANVPKEQLKGLSELALKFGEDTKFSAGEAADAILELAKGGLSTADIKAGALRETLTLAAAGGVDLASAATAVSNGLNTFNLSAGEAGQIAAALAGGANASSASVESLQQALAQVGPGAVNAGLSVQETTAALAAFADAGIQGSDAGTSLKTFLSRLIPTTEGAATAMADLGLKFTDAQGNFLPLANISQQLKERLGELSPAARSAALQTIFGSDATRAASVLFKEGAAGIEAYTKATSDSDAANRQAKTATEGVKGALEQLKGSFETLQIRAGLALAPFVEKAALAGTEVLNGLLPQLAQIRTAFTGTGAEGGAAFASVGDGLKTAGGVLREFGERIVSIVGPAITRIGAVVRDEFLPAFRDALPILRPVGEFLLKVFGEAVVGVITGTVRAISGALDVITGIVKVFVGIFTGDFSGAFDALKQIATGAFDLIIGAVQVFLNLGILSLFRKAATFLVRDIWVGLFNGLRSGAQAGLTSVNNVVNGLLNGLLGFFRNIGTNILSAVTTAFAGIRLAITNAMIAAQTQVGAILAGLRALFSSVFQAILSSVTTAVNAVRNAATAGFTGLVNGARTALSALTGAVSSAFSAALGAARAGISLVLGEVRSLGGKVANAASSLGSALVSAGRELIAGLIRGITSRLSDALDTVRNLAGSIASAAKGALGIASPSKVFAAIGAQSVDGLVLGLNAGQGRAGRAAADLLDVAGMRLGSETFVQNRLGIAADGSTTLPGGGADVVGAIREQTAVMQEAERRRLLYNRQGVR